MKPALLAAALLFATARAEEYSPADRGVAPKGSGVRVLPETFLRGYDPITAYYPDNQVESAGPADDGERRLRIEPAWPGAWSWADERTLQFRPAEPWPALQRFAVSAGQGSGARRVLSTMMSAPQALSPAAGSDELRPFRTVSLTFPQALPLASLKKMLRLDIAELPGLADSPRRNVQRFALAQLPRGSQKDAAVYAVTLEDDVPEGKMLVVSVALALGDEDKLLWQGKLSTRKPFHLARVRCGQGQAEVAGSGALPKDLALSCGQSGEGPQLEFSAPVEGLSLAQLKQLVHLDPAVPDLHFEPFGARIQLRGSFQPEVLYRMRLAAAPVRDDSGRPLKDPRNAELFFYLGFKKPFLRFGQASAILEARGPRTLPATGHGESRADVRVYRIDPLHNGLWPFPDQPVVVNEDSAPPFPGEEPAIPAQAGEEPVDSNSLKQHIRLLGSPLVSRVVDLPIGKRAGTSRFGLDLGALLDPIVGAQKPGTYLVGLRRLTGAPQRAYARVQITNLSLTVVEERDRARFFVRTLDEARPVRGARIVLDGTEVVNVKDPRAAEGFRKQARPARTEVTTGDDGGASLGRLERWTHLQRITVVDGDDALVIDPREPPPRFAANHWSPASRWLTWLFDPPPPPVNDKLIGFVFTERAIYRPGEKVYLKGYLRNKTAGALETAGNATRYGLEVRGPDGSIWPVPLAFTRLEGFGGEWQQKDAPTGGFSAVVFERLPNDQKREIATRSFQVEAYRVPAFEVQLSGAPRVRLDAPFTVKAVARYYAGGAAAGLKLQWTVTRRPSTHSPKGREGYLFASDAQFARPGETRAPETIRREATLDDEGAAEITIHPELDVDGSPRVYRFEATVTGPDEQQVSATQETTALPPFTLGMKLQRYAPDATSLSPQIIAIGVDDKELADQEIAVRLYRRTWHSHLRETNFATGEARYVTEQQDTRLLEKTIRTALDATSVSLPVKEAGVYVVELFARDKLGRVQTLSADLYVGGRDKVAWQKPREGVFALATDKKTYRPGEIAKVILQSPYQTGEALIVVEEPGGNRYRWISVEGGKAVFEQRIGEAHVPNLPLHAVLMRGRLGESAKDDARHRPQTVAASIDLEVEPTPNEIKLKVSHPETARPGSTIEVGVQLSDDKGKPLAGEVTLWLVDEAVLSLAREGPLDPLSAFIDRNQRAVSVRDTRNQVIGRVAEEEEPGGDGAEKELAAGGRKRVVRRNFKTVPFYLATLEVGADGRARVPIQLSDDLTNFKVRAVAASGMRRFGFAQSTLRVRLPVLVQPQLPRFVRQGDRFWPGGISRLLEGTPGAADVTIELTGRLDGNGGKQAIDLQPNKPIGVLVPATALANSAAEPGEIAVKVDVTRRSDGVGDAFEVKLPLLPDRAVERAGWFTRLATGDNALPAFPEKPRAGTAQQKLLITSVPGVLELAAGLDYLATYPHGCLEQKLSQVMPYVAQLGLLRRLDLAERPARVDSPKVLLDDLSQYQDERGLFGYWPGSTGDVALTGQVLSFIAAARRNGYKPDEKVEQRAVDALTRVLRSDYPGLVADYRFDQQSTALRALAQAGRGDQHYLIDLFHHRQAMDAVSEADLSLAMAQAGPSYAPNLEELRGELWDRVILKLHDGQTVFEGVRGRRSAWGDGYLGSDVGTTAAMLEALSWLSPSDGRLPPLRDGLLAGADALRGFGSTYDNRRAIDALATYFDKADHPALEAQVALSNGETIYVDGKRKAASLAVAAGEALRARVSGAGVAARVAYSYLPDAPGDRVESLAQGLLVSRGATVLHADGTQEVRREDKAGNILKVTQGDVVELDAQLTLDADRYFVAFVVPFAAGLEPLNASVEGTRSDAKPSAEDSIAATYVQRLDNESRYYFDRLAKGTYSFRFRLRAASEGSFVHPAPWAELMYQESVRGRGEGMRLVVAGAHEK